MTNLGWLWFAGIVTIAIGCSSSLPENAVPRDSAGSAGSPSNASRDDEDASSGSGSVRPGAAGQGGAPTCSDDADASFGGEAGFSAGGEDGAEDEREACIAGSCRGTREHVADAWGFSCPREFCDGQVMASDCSALPGGALKTTSWDCWNHHVLLFEISPTRRKACYYAGEGLDDPVFLVGATVWDDEPDFCEGRATKISAGQTVDIDSCFDAPIVNTLCDAAHPDLSASQDGTPPKACYNRFGHVCTPCCEATQPDCSHKPDDYPGYLCTPDTPFDEAYCSCSCHDGDWECAC